MYNVGVYNNMERRVGRDMAKLLRYNREYLTGRFCHFAVGAYLCAPAVLIYLIQKSMECKGMGGKGQDVERVKKKSSTIGGGFYLDYVKHNSWIEDYPIAFYMQMTGPNNKEQLDAVKQYTKGKTMFLLLRPLEAMMDQTAADAFNVNAFSESTSPELIRILKAPVPQNLENELFFKSLPEYVEECVENGKLDFSPYYPVEDPQEQRDWLRKQYFHLKPVPIALTGNENTGKGQNENLHSKLWNRMIKEMAEVALIGDADRGIDKLSLDDLLKFADVVEEKYNFNVQKHNPVFFQKIYNQEDEAGFFVNPETGTVYDMRPYADELNRMFVPGWEPLKWYAQGLRKQAKAVWKKLTGKEEDPQAKIFESPFVAMYNGPVMNEFMRLNSYNIKSRENSKNKQGQVAENDAAKKPPQRVDEGRYFMPDLFAAEWTYSSGDTVITMPVRDAQDGHRINKKEIREGVYYPIPLFSGTIGKLLCFLSVLFTRQNSRRNENEKQQSNYKFNLSVHSTVETFMLATGKKITESNKKKMAMTLKKALSDLNDVAVMSKDSKYSLKKVRPFPEVTIGNYQIDVVFSPSFAEYLVNTTGFFMTFPVQLLSLNEKNPNLFSLGYRLALNRSMDNNIRLGKANILSVAICLEHCPGIPSIEAVRAEKGSPYHRIISPFMAVMDELESSQLLTSWEMCGPKGEPVEEAAFTNYKNFSRAFIKYEIKNFPQEEVEKRIKSRTDKDKQKEERLAKLVERKAAEKIATKIVENTKIKIEKKN